MNMTVTEISKRIDEISSIKNSKEKMDYCKKLFYDILNEQDLYVVASPDTTEQEFLDGRIRPHVEKAAKGEFTYLRFFTDEDLAKKYAKRVGAYIELPSIDEKGNIDKTKIVTKEICAKVSVEQLLAMTKLCFINGADGVLVNDGARWITLACEEFLRIGYDDILDNNKDYNKHFIQTIKALYDMAKERVGFVAPFVYYEGICKEDIINGKAKILNVEGELLILEYYDKHKLEEKVSEKIYWAELDNNYFYKIVQLADKQGIEKIRFLYRNKEAVGYPKNVALLMENINLN